MYLVLKKFIKQIFIFKIVEENPLNKINLISLINKHNNYKNCFFIIDTYQINLHSKDFI